MPTTRGPLPSLSSMISPARYGRLTQDSFKEITTYWLKEINNYADANVKILLIGNKSDSSDRKIDASRGAQLAETNGWLFFECSAKKGDNVSEAFLQMTRSLIESKYWVLTQEEQEEGWKEQEESARHNLHPNG